MPAADQPTKSRVSSVKVPGQVAAPAADHGVGFDPEADSAASFEDAVAGAPDLEDGLDVPPSPVLTLTQDQLDAAIARGIAQAQAAQRAAAAALKADPEAGLPNEKDIVLSEIKGKSVLTKQGYVIHPDYGRPAGHLQQFAQS